MRIRKEPRVEMTEVGKNGNGEREKLVQLQVQIQMEPQLDTEVEDWVGVYTKKMQKFFKPGDISSFHRFNLIDYIGELKNVPCNGKNRMALLFSPSSGANETTALKEIVRKMKREKIKPSSGFKIILLDAKNPDSLKMSFEKMVKIYLPEIEMKIDKDKDRENFPDEEKVNEIYSEINSENGQKHQSLFVFVGAQNFSDIKPFLPTKNCILYFCQFLVTTFSKTLDWESESELKSWSILKCLFFDEELIRFDWEGVHSASKLPASFHPISEFNGRSEIMCQLANRFQNFPPPSQASLTVLTGVTGNGKTELIKKFLSTHHQLFTKVVLINARNPWLPLKIFAYDLGIYCESSIEGRTDSDKVSFLHSEITKNLHDNQLQRVLFVFDDAICLEKIKKYLPMNFKSAHVIVTSRSRNWQKEEDLKFYTENNFDFYEIPLFDGLSLEETHEFYSKILQRHGIFYVREDLERSIRELHKLTGGLPLTLKNLTTCISESSRRNPEKKSPKLHILNSIRHHIQNCGEISSVMTTVFKIRENVTNDLHQKSRLLLQILCLMSPEHLDFDMICYFYFEHQKPFRPPEKEEYTKEQTTHVRHLLGVLEADVLIQVNRSDDLNKIKAKIPAFLREILGKFEVNLNASSELRLFLSGINRPFPTSGSSCNSSWTRPLDAPRLWPHILSLNKTHTRFHGYYNEFLLGVIRNHLKFWKNPPKNKETRVENHEEKERKKSPEKDYKTAKEEIKNLLNENVDFKRAFGDFSQVKAPGFFLPFLFFLLFLMDVVTDVNNARVMWRAGYTAYFCLSIFLVVVPFLLLCKVQYWDRSDFSRRMKDRSLNWRDHLRTFTGTTDSYFLRLWYILRFRWETDNLERGLLFERLCILRANAEYHGIANAFMESLPQLLLQFPLYLLSYTEEYSVLREKMQGSFFPYELSLVLSFFNFGLALTKLESVYFGWNIELFGIKLLGYRIIHLLINVTHFATLVFCSGIICFVFPGFVTIISLVFCLTGIAWIIFNIRFLSKQEFSEMPLLLEKKAQKILTFFASFHPAFVEKLKGRKLKLEATSKHQFVNARLGHDLLFLQRRPRTTDMIYLFVFLGSILVSAFTAIYCTFAECQGVPMTTEIIQQTEKLWALSVIQKYSFYLILWLPLLFMWQVLRQLLHNAHLKYSKYSKTPPLTEDNILNDPEGILRYPAYSHRWIQRRIYYQLRQNRPGVFSQTWDQMTEALRKFNKKNGLTKFKILGLFSFRIVCKILYFGLILLLLSLVPYNITLLKVYAPNSKFVP